MHKKHSARELLFCGAGRSSPEAGPAAVLRAECREPDHFPISRAKPGCRPKGLPHNGLAHNELAHNGLADIALFLPYPR